MKYPIILCEDDLLQLHQLERVIDKFILFHDEIFEVVLSAQKPSEVEAYLKQFHPKQGIYFLEASSMPHRLSLITKNGQYEFYGKLTDFEKKYEALTRINRSCLANLKNVQKTDFKAKEVYFTEEVYRSFSSSKTKSIKAFLNTMF